MAQPRCVEVGRPVVASLTLQSPSGSPPAFRSRCWTGQGHIAPTRKDTSSQRKALSEMSQDELAASIASNQAEIDKVEGELASRAKDVSYHV
ncbi:DUF1192 family protein [Bradyrhizobium japonicum]|nr:DUF1192 family protein [Bradyrhizobium japonicum]